MANTPKLFRLEAGGFIGWLDDLNAGQPAVDITDGGSLLAPPQAPLQG
jgi:hypothetical protein